MVTSFGSGEELRKEIKEFLKNPIQNTIEMSEEECAALGERWEQGFAHHGYIVTNWMNKVVVTGEQSRWLYYLEQNSVKWSFLRRFFVGASEYMKMLYMSKFPGEYDYFAEKRGRYGFAPKILLNFKIGHFFEETGAQAVEYVFRSIFKVENWRLDEIGVVCSLRQPFTWASIDRLPTSTEKVRFNDLDIDLAHTLVELKVKARPKYEFRRPLQDYIAQVQKQMNVMNEMHGWPEKLIPTRYVHTALLCILELPFYGHTEHPFGVSLNIKGNVDEIPSYAKLTMWMIPHDKIFQDQTEREEDHFISKMDEAGDSLEGEEYQPSLDFISLPRPRFVGSWIIPFDALNVNGKPLEEQYLF